jgi:hypothetical protein
MSFMSNHVIHVKSCHSSQIMPFMLNHVIHVVSCNLVKSCHSCQIMSFMSNHVIHVKSCDPKFSLLVEKMLQELKINTEGLNLKKASSIQRFFTNQCLESRINSSARQVTIWPHYLHEEVRDNRVIFLSFVKSERDALAISNGFFTVFILKNNIPCNKPRTNLRSHSECGISRPTRTQASKCGNTCDFGCFDLKVRPGTRHKPESAQTVQPPQKSPQRL